MCCLRTAALGQWPESNGIVQVWCMFSIVTLYVFYLCMRSNKLDPSTPRLVFTWFLYSHNFCIAIGAAGYALFLLELLGASPLVWLLFGKGASFNLLFYGLYFGVLGRDTAEVASTGLVRKPLLVSILSRRFLQHGFSSTCLCVAMLMAGLCLTAASLLVLRYTHTVIQAARYSLYRCSCNRICLPQANAPVLKV